MADRVATGCFQRCAVPGRALSEYPYWSSVGFLPWPIVPEQRVGEDDELAHDGGNGDLLRLPGVDPHALALRSGLSVTPRRELVETRDLMIGNALEDIGQPCLRVDAVELRRFDQRIGWAGGGMSLAPRDSVIDRRLQLVSGSTAIRPNFGSGSNAILRRPG